MGRGEGHRVKGERHGGMGEGLGGREEGHGERRKGRWVEEVRGHISWREGRGDRTRSKSRGKEGGGDR